MAYLCERRPFHFDANAVQLLVQNRANEFRIRDELVTGQHPSHPVMMIRALTGAGVFCQADQGRVSGKVGDVLVRRNTALIAERPNIHIMLQASRRNDDIANVQIRVHRAGHSGKPDRFRSKAIDQDLRCGCGIDFADAGFTHDNIPSVQYALDESGSCGVNLFLTLYLFEQQCDFFIHGPHQAYRLIHVSLSLLFSRPSCGQNYCPRILKKAP
ncbi:hypothetical protein D3C74_299110 [compost metagenome]